MVPVVAEDTIDPRVNVPKGLNKGILYVIIMAFLTGEDISLTGSSQKMYMS